MNTFSKVAGYKINIQKPVEFLYTSNEHSEKEIRETIPLTKYLGINLMKEVKDLYNEN
jgi:hypothetical protein